MAGLVAAAALSAADAEGASLRGKLAVGSGGRPALRLTDGALVLLAGDEQTTGVINDKRLRDADFEVIGRRSSPAEFTIGPIHTRAMFVHKDGKRLAVTYWCDVCAIRTYTPGLCWCCREDTELDLRDPATIK